MFLFIVWFQAVLRSCITGFSPRSEGSGLAQAKENLLSFSPTE